MHDSDPDDDFNVSLSSLSGRDSEVMRLASLQSITLHF